MNTKKLLKTFIPALSFLAFGLAHAAAFQSFEQSATLMGQANAGTTVTDDPSIAYYNPATMAFFKHTALGLSVIDVDANIDFQPYLATNHLGAQIGGDTFSPATINYLPAFYVVVPINDGIAFGFSAASPFGLSTMYDDSSLARYFATESKIQTINLSPSIAIKIGNYFSVGVGADEMFVKANLNQGFDLESLIPPQLNDVFVNATASAWATGWNAGLYFQPTDRTKFGLGYHSPLKANLTGHSTVLGVAPIIAPVATLLGFTNADVSSGLNLPGYLTLSAQQDVTNRWSVMGDIEYITWSSLKNITLTFAPQPSSSVVGVLPPDVIPLNYRNTWRLAVGQDYQLNNKVTLRAGVAYDQTPVRSNLRDARLPDTDRVWLSAGADYHFTKNLTGTVDYSHIMFQRSSIYNTNTINVPVGGKIVPLTAVLAANYQATANLIGAELTYRFG